MKIGIGGHFGGNAVFFRARALSFPFVRGRTTLGTVYDYVNVIVLEFRTTRFGSYCTLEGVCDHGFIGGDFMKCLVLGRLIQSAILVAEVSAQPNVMLAVNVMAEVADDTTSQGIITLSHHLANRRGIKKTQRNLRFKYFIFNL